MKLLCLAVVTMLGGVAVCGVLAPTLLWGIKRYPRLSLALLAVYTAFAWWLMWPPHLDACFAP